MHAELPLLLGHLGHQGAHRWSSATAATSATTGWSTSSCATTRQNHALFYSDNAPIETHYVSRNRQLSTFNDVGARRQGVVHADAACRARYDVKLNGAYEYSDFKFKDFTDLRTGNLYGYSASVAAAVLSATY